MGSAMAIRHEDFVSDESYDTDLNQHIRKFGTKIFEAMHEAAPSTFNKKYWIGRIMEWSMQRPEFKLNMFRLVDVLPNLRSSSEVARHVNEYLGDVGAEMGALVRWGLNVDPDSLRAKLTAMAVRVKVNQMAGQFIAGESPQAALNKLKRMRAHGIAFTADLLGEYCVSEREALAYVERYLEALDVFGQAIPSWREASPIIAGHPGEQSPICISIKPTALYSQCSPLNFERSVETISERLSIIARKAREVNALLYIDAEDSNNNEIIYPAFKRVFGSAEFRDFPYPGMVVQAYAKGAEARVHELLDFARGRGNPIAIRLVKGAYWDLETILSIQGNMESPLFAHKSSSDANFEKLSRVLLDNRALVLPAFGSHNIRSLSHACCYAQRIGLKPTDFELQMLYGMADPIAAAFVGEGYLVRYYVPLGDTLVGMGYLVRRLLENTSNESFLRHTFADHDQIQQLLKEPQFAG